jgi:hypothetical protein
MHSLMEGRDANEAHCSPLCCSLAKELFTTVLAAGFEPYLGFCHQPSYGRLALALDMMEEFRPVIADATALTLFNESELSDKDFIKTGIGVSLTTKGKKKVIAGYERRMETEITHPLFGLPLRSDRQRQRGNGGGAHGPDQARPGPDHDIGSWTYGRQSGSKD